jgi:two-component system LytT family response regulator
VKLRALIVDDEDLARARLCRLLAREPSIEVVGEAEDGESAQQALRRLKPDAVFLDVQMPGLDGFGVLRGLGAEEAPLVVFVTAWEQHALQAFEVNAVDYLLKPYSTARLRDACRRLQERRGRAAAERDRLRTLLEEIRGGAPAALDRLLVPTGHGARVVRCQDVDWIGAADNYVELHVGRATLLLREALSALAPRLDERQFLRIHRSTLVNLDRVRELHPLLAGDATVVLADGQQLRVSRSHRPALEARLRGWPAANPSGG